MGEAHPWSPTLLWPFLPDCLINLHIRFPVFTSVPSAGIPPAENTAYFFAIWKPNSSYSVIYHSFKFRRVLNSFFFYWVPHFISALVVQMGWSCYTYEPMCCHWAVQMQLDSLACHMALCCPWWCKKPLWWWLTGMLLSHWCAYQDRVLWNSRHHSEFQKKESIY